MTLQGSWTVVGTLIFSELLKSKVSPFASAHTSNKIFYQHSLRLLQTVAPRDSILYALHQTALTTEEIGLGEAEEMTMAP
jgi:hypothetical protein